MQPGSIEEVTAEVDDAEGRAAEALRNAERVAAEARQLVEAGWQLASKPRHSSAKDTDHAKAMLAEAQALLEHTPKLTHDRRMQNVTPTKQ